MLSILNGHPCNIMHQTQAFLFINTRYKHARNLYRKSLNNTNLILHNRHISKFDKKHRESITKSKQTYIEKPESGIRDL